jgi:hypothetical protein
MNNLAFKRIVRRLKPETLIWVLRGYSMPAPFHAKINTLKRYSTPNSDWIETGTYLAETSLKLAKLNRKNQVYSIEPAKEIYEFVKSKYSKISNLNFLNGTSEELFESTLLKTGKELNLWLDGHYSGDVTFKGEIDSPIIHELDCLAKHVTKFKTISLFIDDFRLFGTSDGYPEKEYLVRWAESNDFSWNMENDIFIARKFN